MIKKSTSAGEQLDKKNALVKKDQYSISEFRELMKQTPATKTRGKSSHSKESEHDIQAGCVKWFRTVYPQYANDLRAIPNGGTTATAVNQKTGKSYSLEGQRFKAEGLVPGTPDLFLSVPKTAVLAAAVEKALVIREIRYAGLWIEMKAPGGSLSDAQIIELMRLQANGYAIAVCWTRKEFEAAVVPYLKSEPMPELLLLLPIRRKSDAKNLQSETTQRERKRKLL